MYIKWDRRTHWSNKLFLEQTVFWYETTTIWEHSSSDHGAFVNSIPAQSFHTGTLMQENLNTEHKLCFKGIFQQWAFGDSSYNCILLQSIMFWLVFLFWEILPFPSTCLRYLLSHVEHSNGKGMYTAAWMRSGWILSGYSAVWYQVIQFLSLTKKSPVSFVLGI